MNGIFKLGLVGEQKSLLGALQSSREYLGKEAFESGARTEGVQPFGKTNKLVLESSGACAMGDAEELFSHLCRRFPELEGILLLHNTDCYTDYGDDDAGHVRVLVQVHYFAPHELNTVAMRREITRRIAAAGFTRPSITPASDGTSQHYVYECEDVVATSEV